MQIQNKSEGQQVKDALSKKHTEMNQQINQINA